MAQHVNAKTSRASAASTSSGASAPRERGRDLVTKTLSEDYPGLDYLGFHNVLHAKNVWYRVLWFTIVSVCLFVGLYTIYRILLEYVNNPSATLISVKSLSALKTRQRLNRFLKSYQFSMDKLLLPQLTVCATHAGTINLARLEGTLFHTHATDYSQADVLNFAYFMLAGSGFQKMKSNRLDSLTQKRMASFYDVFRGDMTISDFFSYFMDTFGLQCHEFLQDCRLGDIKLDCCKSYEIVLQAFEPEYLMRRGRCFRSIPLFQQSYDELGKFRVSLRQPFSMDPRMPTENEILTFLAEHKRQIAPFPRYYLYPDTWTKARISARWISLFPGDKVCSEESSALSKDTCYVQQWLRSKLEEPHNCTYPYMHNVRNVSLPSCHPLTIVQSYETTVEAPSYTMHSCVLPCQRWEYNVALERTPSSVILKNARNLEFTYRIDVSYNDLQYEEIKEVSTLTLAGLIAQIGGQLSLFMGSSILNLTQFIIMVVILMRRALRKRQLQGVSDVATNTIHSPPNFGSTPQKFENAAFDAHLTNLTDFADNGTSKSATEIVRPQRNPTKPYNVKRRAQQSDPNQRSAPIIPVKKIQPPSDRNGLSEAQMNYAPLTSTAFCKAPPLPPHYDAVNRLVYTDKREP